LKVLKQLSQIFRLLTNNLMFYLWEIN